MSRSKRTGGTGKPAWAPRVIVLALALSMAVFLAACGGSDDDSDGGSGGATATNLSLFKDMQPAPGAEAVDTSEFKTDSEQLTIGFSDVSLVNSWRVQARKSAEIKAKEWKADLVVTDANGDPKKQIADIEDLLTQEVDALVVSPVDPKAVVPILDRAAGTGIPVIIWSGEAETDSITSEVVANDRQFGEEGGEFLCDALKPGDDVIMLRGIPGITVEVDRYEGAKEKLDGCGLNVVGEEYGQWAFAQGKTAAENLLAANSQIDGVWSSGAEMTRGAVQAFEEAGRPLVPMSGEALNGFLKLWVKDDLDSVAPAYAPWMGAEAVKLAILALQGEEIQSDYEPQAAPVTSATVKQEVKDNLPDEYWLDNGYLTEAQLQQVFGG